MTVARRERPFFPDQPVSYCEGCAVDIPAGQRICFECGAESLLLPPAPALPHREDAK